MLAPDSRTVYSDVLRSPPGYRLDCAVATTFSLNLETLLVLPFTLATQRAEDPDALLRDPVALLESLRETTGRLAVFFRRGWQVPTTLERDALRALVARVTVFIGEDLKVERFRIVRSSGNPDFDLSVEQQLQRLVDSQAVIPPPPEEVASNYLGREVGFNYLGRDAR